MIVKGGSGGKGGHAGALARHLMRTDENSRVELLEYDPTAPSENLKAILSEFQMLAQTNSNGALGFYHASINPQADDRSLSPEEWAKAANILENHLGFNGQPRAIVLHEKDGREHIHVIWQRYDIETGKLRSYSQNYKKHVEAAREMEEVLDLHRFKDITQEQSYDYADTQKAQRTELSVKDRKAIITDAYKTAENSHDFTTALEAAGFDLARGDKPNTFVAIDSQGEVFSLVRQITGVKKAEVHNKLLPIKPEHLQSVSEIRAARDGMDLHKIEDQARTEIAAQFAHERLAIDARHALERETMAAKFKSENAAVNNKRNTIKVRQEANRKDFGRLIKKEPLRAQNVTWWKQDQRRLSQQQIAFDRLKKRQEIELGKLTREEKRALNAHDKMQKSYNGLRYAQSQEDRLLAQTRLALQRLELDDRQPNSTIAHHKRHIDKLQTQKRSDERRLTTYLYHQEQSRHVFRQSFENADSAYTAFRDYARQHGLKQAQDRLIKTPEQFGSMTADIDTAQIETINASLRAIHYTEKKMFTVRARIEEKFDIDKAMQDHGITDLRWQVSTVARSENLGQKINAHKAAIKKSYNAPDDRRLLLMAEATKAVSRLDTETYLRLPKRDQQKLKAIKTTLEIASLKSRLDELNRNRRSYETIRAHERYFGDPPHL